MKSNLIQVGGLAAVLAGPLLLATDVWGLFFISGDSFSEVAATTSWVVSYALHLIGALLLLVALVGLYARQSEASGALGLVGFLAALVGTGLLVGNAFSLAFVLPSAAVEAPEFLDIGLEEAVLAGLGNTMTIWSGSLGWALFGVATIRARIFPRVAAVALVITALLGITPVGIFGFFAFCLAVTWLGLAVLRETGRTPSADPVGAEIQPRVQ